MRRSRSGSGRKGSSRRSLLGTGIWNDTGREGGLPWRASHEDHDDNHEGSARWVGWEGSCHPKNVRSS